MYTGLTSALTPYATYLLYGNIGTAGEFLDQFAEVARQTVERVVLRIHRPDDFIHRPRQLPRGGADLIEVFRRLRRIVHAAARRLA
jgi:hypothetical protein